MSRKNRNQLWWNGFWNTSHHHHFNNEFPSSVNVICFCFVCHLHHYHFTGTDFIPDNNCVHFVISYKVSIICKTIHVCIKKIHKKIWFMICCMELHACIKNTYWIGWKKIYKMCRELMFLRRVIMLTDRNENWTSIPLRLCAFFEQFSTPVWISMKSFTLFTNCKLLLSYRFSKRKYTVVHVCKLYAMSPSNDFKNNL